MKYLITGAAGFIGFHLSKRLLGQGNSVVGIDNLNEYYTDLGGFDPARDVLSVDVWLDNPLLNNDVVLIDSPGIGSVSRQHEAITREEIFRADAVIYLFNSNQNPGCESKKSKKTDNVRNGCHKDTRCNGRINV